MMARKRAGQYAYVNEHVGDRMRVRRTLLGMGQEKLAEALGLSFQQIQKYEKGANRVSASRLFEISKILNVPASYFFDNVPMDTTSEANSLREDGAAAPLDTLTSRETLKLIHVYYGLPDPALREVIFRLIEALADD